MEDCIYLENSVLGRFIYTFKMEGLFGFKKCLRKHSLSIQTKRTVLRSLTLMSIPKKSICSQNA